MNIQAWGAVPVFADVGRFARTEVLQVPIFNGAPTPEILKYLANVSLDDFLTRVLTDPAVHVFFLFFLELCVIQIESFLWDSLVWNLNTTMR